VNICFVEEEPAYGGGSEKVCLDLARGFAATDAVYLLYDKPGSMLPDYERCCKALKRCPVVPFGWRSVWRSVKGAVELRRQFREWSIDAVVCSNVHYLRILALAVWGTGIRVLFHLGLPALRPMASKRLAYRKMHFGVSPSAHTAQTWIQDGWRRDRICVIPNWVDPVKFRPVEDRAQLRRRLNLPVTGSIVCFVGRLVEEKGIRTLINAFAQVAVQCPDAVLVCVGTSSNGDCEPWKSSALESGLTSDQLVWAGKTTQPELYLAAADVATVPSEWDEPFGLVVLEAMACETVPVVTDVGVLPEIVGEDRDLLVCRRGDINSLAERILTVLRMSEDDRRDIGRGLRQRALEEYGFEPAFQKYRECLRDLNSQRASQDGSLPAKESVWLDRE
jgi:glycosyltransferase involved in cell wall biosynthesis